MSSWGHTQSSSRRDGFSSLNLKEYLTQLDMHQSAALLLMLTQYRLIVVSECHTLHKIPLDSA